MDPISHLAFGRALAAIVPRPVCDRGLTAAIVIGSIAPDVDAVLMPTGWDRYLIWHQRGTHAIAGTIVVALALAIVVRLLRRGPPLLARFPHLAAAAWIGGLGHITLDAISGGVIRPFAPWWGATFGEAWTAMADPLLAVPLLLFAIAAWIWRRQARRLAIVTVAAIAAVIAVKEASRRAAVTVYQQAIAAGDRAPAVPPALAPLEARWGSWTRWWAFDREGTVVRRWEIDVWRREARLLFTRDADMVSTLNSDVAVATAGSSSTSASAAAPAASPPTAATTTRQTIDGLAAIVEASTRLETVRHLHELFAATPPVLLFPAVQPRGDLVEVLWADIRFCAPSFCALWFGGTFDAGGRPREQVVVIGTYRQTRAP